jgi:bifunctional non-homologous end joining protein LigD
MEEIAAQAPPHKTPTPRRGGRSSVRTTTPRTTTPHAAPRAAPRAARDAAGTRTRSKASAKRGSTTKRRTPPRTVAARGTEKPAGGRRPTRATRTSRAASSRSATPVRRAARAPDPGGQTDGEGLPRLPFALTHLDKVFFPRDGYTKGDVVRYYVRVSPQLLPVMRDRPLALKRYPDGIGRPFFFQQKAPPPDQAPPGVRVELVMVESEGGPRPRFIGGSLATLLYTVQLGCIGVDPWHARVQSLDTPDYAVIDLDPGDGVAFRRTVEVARWVHDVLESWGLAGVPKTSGSRGIHIYIPLPPRSTDAVAVGLTQHIAARVVALHPRHATLERDIARRPPASVYVDCLQNARGKTVAAAYSVRAVDGARVSMPLRWDELTPRLDPREFTIVTAPSRIAEIGDLWAEGMARRNAAAAVRRAMG